MQKLVFSLLFVCNLVNSSDWNYYENGPLTWANDYSQYCDGSTQSPINIMPSNALNGRINKCELHHISQDIIDNTLLKLWDWNDQYIHHFTVKNNGHSISLSASSGDVIARLPNFIDTTSEHSEYCLDSIHFHWGTTDNVGSEHKINNIQYPSEIHFVHYSCNYDTLTSAIEDAYINANDEYVLAVVSVMVNIDENKESNVVFSSIGDEYCNLRDYDSQTEIKDLNLLGSIIPYINEIDDSNTFYHYKGSLTTPNCNEIVNWFVLDASVSVKSDDLSIFRQFHDTNGKLLKQNWRFTQQNANNVYSFAYPNNDQNDD